jgi:hypothetical protein
MHNPAEYPFAEALQEDREPAAPSGWPADERREVERGWSADRAHARIRLLAGIVGLGGTALIVAILVMHQIAGGSAHG